MHLLFLFFSAVVLFFFSGFLGKIMYHHKDTLFKYSTYHSYSNANESLAGNFILKTFFPCLYIVALSWFLQVLNYQTYAKNIWIVVVLYWVIRLIWILFIFNLSALTNFTYEIISLILSISAALFVYYIFIDYCIQYGISVFLSRDELRSGIAFALLLYLVNIIWKVLNSNGLFSRSKIYNEKLLLGDLERRTNKLFMRYGKFVNTTLHNMLDEQKFIEKEYFITSLLFSIMIIEDRNRPFIVRCFENLCHMTVKRNKVMTIGIMQVKSTSSLSDEESIEKALSIIVGVLDEFENDPNIGGFDDYSVASRVCELYNSSYDYFSEVDFIQQTIGDWLDIAAE
ncbi:MAG: hypothetical protein ABFD03_06815 [Clostridiaceae bacterium]